MSDDSGAVDGSEDLRHAPQHVTSAQDPDQLLLIVHAVLDRQHAGLQADHWPDDGRGVLGVEGFDAEEHHVGGRLAVELLEGAGLHDPFAVHV